MVVAAAQGGLTLDPTHVAAASDTPVMDLTDVDPGLARLAEEQAALRRIAMLAARGADRVGVFTAVAEEVGRLLDADASHAAVGAPVVVDGELWGAVMVGSAGDVPFPRGLNSGWRSSPIWWHKRLPTRSGNSSPLRANGWSRPRRSSGADSSGTSTTARSSAWWPIHHPPARRARAATRPRGGASVARPSKRRAGRRIGERGRGLTSRSWPPRARVAAPTVASRRAGGGNDHRGPTRAADDACDLAIARVGRGRVPVDDARTRSRTEAQPRCRGLADDVAVTLFAVVGRAEAAPVGQRLRAGPGRRVEVAADVVMRSQQRRGKGARVRPGSARQPGG